MSRFYFDIDDGHDSVRDERGVEVDDLSDIPTEVLAILPDMLESVLPNEDNRAFRIEVRNDESRVVYRATLSLTAGWVRDS
jgi:hypothetical protein